MKNRNKNINYAMKYNLRVKAALISDVFFIFCLQFSFIFNIVPNFSGHDTKTNYMLNWKTWVFPGDFENLTDRSFST